MKGGKNRKNGEEQRMEGIRMFEIVSVNVFTFLFSTPRYSICQCCSFVLTRKNLEEQVRLLRLNCKRTAAECEVSQTSVD